MKQKVFVPVLTAALFVGCTGQDGSNEAADGNNLVEPIENAASNAIVNTSEGQGNVTSGPADAATTAEPAAPQPPPPASTAPPEGPGAKRPAVPPPQPKGEPDPHAGHDMGNMANMQH